MLSSLPASSSPLAASSSPPEYWLSSNESNSFFDYLFPLIFDLSIINLLNYLGF
tara:strand:+ start:913 stop:1074 length:162 start_codon:yes stop_codon:yes gene_type:complete